MIVFGLIGAAAAVPTLRRPRFRDAASRSLLLWLVWFFAMAAYFSTSGFFHRYYLCLIAPSVSALSGLAFVNLRRHVREKSWRSWLFPLAVLATAGVQIGLLQSTPGWSGPLIFGLGSLVLVSTEMLVFPKFRGSLGPVRESAAAALGLAGLLIAPLAWSMTPLIYGGTPNMPAAGPQLAGGGANAGPGPGPAGGPGQAGPRAMALIARLRMGPGAGPGVGSGPGAGGRPANDELRTTNLMKFVLSHRQGEKFILAVPTARQAWDIILETGAPVMAMGGFMGSDHILTPEKIDRMVRAGDIRYFLVRKMPALPAGLRSLGQRFAPARAAGPGPGGGPMGGGDAQLAVEKWIEEHGRPVAGEEWKDEEELNRDKAVGPPSPRTLAFPGRALWAQLARGGGFALYDLKPIADHPK
jgi:4-amino-4-deoxy-L-arabinose transferase-like glycosyltransferase